jgi:hypothetical protein
MANHLFSGKLQDGSEVICEVVDLLGFILAENEAEIALYDNDGNCFFAKKGEVIWESCNQMSCQDRQDRFSLDVARKY